MTKRMDIYNKFHGHCAYCGKEISHENMHIDHIIPRKKGGRSNISNLNPSCCSCNTSKGAMDVDEFKLYKMISASIFKGVITQSQWKMMADRGVFINLPTIEFFFESRG